MGIDFSGVSMAFDVDVYNPNPLPIMSPRLKYALNVEGSRFFDAETTSSINLPAGKAGMVTFPVRVSYSDLWRTYQKLANAPEANYTLDGAFVFPIRGRSLQLPFSHGGTFPILRPPTFSDIKVRVGEMSLADARIDVDAAMKNPNVFPLGIKDLGYALKLGNVQLGDLTARTDEILNAGEKGQLSLSGKVSAFSAVVNLIRGGAIGGAAILPEGSIETPYGAVRLPK